MLGRGSWLPRGVACGPVPSVNCINQTNGLSQVGDVLGLRRCILNQRQVFDVKGKRERRECEPFSSLMQLVNEDKFSCCYIHTLHCTKSPSILSRHRHLLGNYANGAICGLIKLQMLLGVHCSHAGEFAFSCEVTSLQLARARC